MIFRLLTFFIIFLPTAVSFAQNTLTYPPGTVDDLVIIEGAGRLGNGARLHNVRPTADGKSFELTDGAVTGSLILPVIPSRFPFNEAIPSWNGWVSKDGGFRVWLNVAFADRSPGTWFDAGTWGRVPDELTTRVIPLKQGVYNIDYLQLNKLASGVSVRFDFFRTTPTSESPRIHLFALSYSNSTGNPELARQFQTIEKPIPQTINRKVPYYSQVVKNSAWIGRICSPCSVNMVLSSFGVKRDTQSVAAMLFDPVADAFGVWHRSVQGAAQEGVRGYITRFRTWNNVYEHLKAGSLIAASIRFKPGEVNDPLRPHGKRKNGTEGHLILIKGITSDGKVIVHDTTSKDFGVDSVWMQEDLAKAWFDKGGVSYVFTGYHYN